MRGIVRRMGHPKQPAVILAMVLLLAVTAAAPAGARLGVGINVGRIQVEEDLRPGGRYTLATITVLNTGDEAAEFGFGILYQEGQEEARPPEEWFFFDPPVFHLEPGESQAVEVRLRLPLSAQPDRYFALLAARPETTAQGVAIGVAAATKATFTVKPSGLLSALRYLVTGYLKSTAPWSYVTLAAAGLAGLWLLARRRYHLEFAIRKRPPEGPPGGDPHA